ncbi:hypothetical protein [Hyalangium gracile]|uniref:hypothetical protein n=1 Tax=Hyalangium gracile TaxID=394092 RepID=UPI001CCB77F5|nr:hypothetical protein [Hyalangium gracile]
MTRRARLPVWGVLVLCGLMGCAGRQRENYLRDRAAEHVYSKPLAEIWPRVKAVLDDQGYYWDEDTSQGYLLETDWKAMDGGASQLGRSYRRFLIQGTEEKGGGARLRVLHHELSARQVVVDSEGRRVGPITSPQGAMVDSSHRGYRIQTEVWRHADRDLQMEWELFRAIEPEAAAALEKEAAAKFPK